MNASTHSAQLARFGRIAVTGAVLALALIMPSSASSAGGWSTPVKISADMPLAWFPAVAADSRGDVHVVWNSPFQDEGPYKLGALFYARGNGSGWSTPNDIALIWRGHALRSSIAADSHGSIHLTYKGFGYPGPEAYLYGGLGEEIIWQMSAPGSKAERLGAWSAPSKVSAGAAYFSDLAIDSRGVLHVIFTEGGEAGLSQLFYRRSTDGGANWSRPVALDWGNSVWWYRAQLRIDAWDRLHVVWENSDMVSLGVTLGAVHAVSSDGGETWRTSRFQRREAGAVGGNQAEVLVPGPQQPAIGIDGRGQVILVYREPETQRLFFHLAGDPGDWGPALPLPGVAQGVYRPYDMYDMITDSAGRVHLVITAYLTGSDWLSLLHLVWDGRSWTAPTIVTTAPPTPVYQTPVPTRRGEPDAGPLLSPPYPEYPRLALGNGNQLHLVWFGGNRPNVNRDPVGIWYSTLQTDAPAIDHRPTPTGGDAGQPRQPAVTDRPPVPPPPVPARPMTLEALGLPSETQRSEHRRWQEYPLLLGGGVVALVLLAVLTMRLRPFDRSGR